jgi:hypothetical protein
MAQRLRSLGELDQHDADVFDHREQHLAQVLRLHARLLAHAACGERVNGIHPRDAGDERGDVRAEIRRDAPLVVAADGGETHHKCGNQRIGIEALRGEDAGGAERACDERLAVGATCIAEGSVRQLVRRGEARAVGVGIDRTEGFEPRAHRLRRGSLRRGRA